MKSMLLRLCAIAARRLQHLPVEVTGVSRIWSFCFLDCAHVEHRLVEMVVRESQEPNRVHSIWVDDFMLVLLVEISFICSHICKYES